MVFLLALLLLTALVWWRVLNRHDTTSSASPSCSTSSSSSNVLPTPAVVTVQVYNSTKRNGIAKSARSALLKDGFRIPDQATNDPTKGTVKGVAEIRYPPDTASGARLLRYYFPTAVMKLTTATDGKVVVSLGAKYKHVATQAAVAAALKRDSVTLRKETGSTPVTSSC
jgi:hypothetical protein